MTTGGTSQALRKYLAERGTHPDRIDALVGKMDGGAVAPQLLAPVSRGTIVLPWSCLASDNVRHAKLAAHSPAYKLARTRAHEEAAKQWPGAPIAGAVRVAIVLTPPNHARRDITNFLKCLLDALSENPRTGQPAVAYLDDSQIAELTIRRAAVDVDRPKAAITIEEVLS